MIEHDDYAGTGTEGPKPKSQWLCEIPGPLIPFVMMSMVTLFSVFGWRSWISVEKDITVYLVMFIPLVLSSLSVIFISGFIRRNIIGTYIYAFRAEDGMTWFHSREPFLHEGKWIAVNEKTKKTVALKKNSIVARIPVGGLRRSSLIYSTGTNGALGVMWRPVRVDLKTVTIVPMTDSSDIFQMTLELPAALAFLEEFSCIPGMRLGKSGEKLFETKIGEKVYARQMIVMVSQGYLEDREALHERELLKSKSMFSECDLELKMAEFRHDCLRIAVETMVAKIFATKDSLGRSKHAQIVREFCENALSDDEESRGMSLSDLHSLLGFSHEARRQALGSLWNDIAGRIQGPAKSQGSLSDLPRGRGIKN